jgi:hypothetical protein
MATDKNNTTSFSGRRIVLVDTDIPSIARGQLNELKSQLSHLEGEESVVLGQKGLIDKREEILQSLQSTERNAITSDRSRAIERKRRRLNQQEDQSTGPPKIESEIRNVYDYFATTVQKVIRSWLARCWVSYFRKIRHRAAIVIEAGIRGWLSRLTVHRILNRNKQVVYIQKMYRGWQSRVSYYNDFICIYFSHLIIIIIIVLRKLPL